MELPSGCYSRLLTDIDDDTIFRHVQYKIPMTRQSHHILDTIATQHQQPTKFKQPMKIKLSNVSNKLTLICAQTLQLNNL